MRQLQSMRTETLIMVQRCDVDMHMHHHLRESQTPIRHKSLSLLWKQGKGSVHAPVQARHPAATQTIKLIPTLPALRLTRAGELNIPLPICRPTTRLSPLQYVTVFSFSRRACPDGSSVEAVRGKSMSL